ncbi:MAG TPA: vWA domain-containing protein [Planctomicrobium sp.]|nr:vWA domain-containing protein [Planctomicrobium sp.]
MPESPINPERFNASVNDWGASYAYIGSLVMHLFGLGLLAAIVLPGLNTLGDGNAAISISNSIDTTLASADGLGTSVELSGGFESFARESNSTATQEADTAARLLMTRIVDDSFVTLKSGDGFVSHQEESISSDEFLQPVSGKAGNGRPGGQGSGEGSGDGTNSGDGKGSGTKDFFGAGTRHPSTVFVVDASSSMNFPYPGPARTRFNRVKFELLKTITAMTENDRFFIIFFGDGPMSMPARTLVTGDEASKQFYLNWMAQVPAQSQQTMPRDALIRAIRLKPQAIYFLTDGQITLPFVTSVTKFNKTGIPIHTIGFASDRGEKLLREIADQNNGTYTYIPEESPNEEPKP